MHLRHVCYLSSLLVLLMSMQVLADPSSKPSNNKIVKWVDSKGVTHYGDVPPPEYAGTNTVISTHGVVLKRNEVAPTSKSIEMAEKDQSEQRRKDQALLASYTLAEEIDLARDRHLQMGDMIVQGLQQRRATAVKQLESNQKFADNLKRIKKPMPQDLIDDLKTNQNDIASIDQQLAQQKATMDETRSKFDAEKKRFIELKAAAIK